MTTCDITFENNRLKVFSTGKLLRGSVHLTLQEEKKVRGVYVRIWGRAYARVRSGKSTYKGKEDYLNEKIYLVGGRNAEVTLTPGEYFHQFECMLPSDLPTSCEGNVGYIRYSVEVVLDIPFWPDKEFEELFTVIKPLDLNDEYDLRRPSVAEKSHRFWLCCCACCFPSKPVKILARTPVTGYTPGQTINMDIEIQNDSNRAIPKFTVAIIKEIKYKLRLDSCLPIPSKHTDVIIVRSKETDGCGAFQEKHLRVNFVVPAIPPTDISTSNIVKVRYFIKITGSTSFCHLKPELNLPITIGTFPIRDDFNGLSKSYGGATKQSETNGSGSTLKPLLDNDPPTYQEAIYLNDNSGNNSFKPVYPVFARQTSYAVDEVDV